MFDRKEISRFVSYEFIKVHQAIEEDTNLLVVFLKFLQREVSLLFKVLSYHSSSTASLRIRSVHDLGILNDVLAPRKNIPSHAALLFHYCQDRLRRTNIVDF
jgi:hypothetical protein